MWANDDKWEEKATEELVQKYNASTEAIDILIAVCGSNEETYRDMLRYYSNGEESFDFELEEVNGPSFDDFEDEWRLGFQD